jgi:predicted RecB family nuclease
LDLNHHWILCEFKTRCHRIAIETDNLSLIGTLGEKERRRLREKGINTVTQLSYGYRPRRKRGATAIARTGAAATSLKNDNKLRALAIKKQQIHVLCSPQVKRRQTPVYFDVEGFSGGHFYYLIGMRFKIGDDWNECSLWADRRQDECLIWKECIRQLRALENPQIIHFGSYETNFLRRMKERYPALLPNPEFVDELLGHSTNLLSPMYGTIYFPTFTNGLKDIAQYLGFRWTDAVAGNPDASRFFAGRDSAGHATAAARLASVRQRRVGPDVGAFCAQPPVRHIAVRVDGYVERPFDWFGHSFDGHVEDEGPKSAQMPRRRAPTMMTGPSG